MKSLDDVIILVVADRAWGRGATLEEALKKVPGRLKPRKYKAYLTHKSTYIDDIGAAIYPTGFAPRLIIDKWPEVEGFSSPIEN